MLVARGSLVKLARSHDPVWGGTDGFPFRPSAHGRRAVALVGAASLQRGESTWPSYGGSQASLKYSPLDQIDRSNAGRMKIAWRWRSIDEDTRAESLE